MAYVVLFSTLSSRLTVHSADCSMIAPGRRRVPGSRVVSREVPEATQASYDETTGDDSEARGIGFKVCQCAEPWRWKKS